MYKYPFHSVGYILTARKQNTFAGKMTIKEVISYHTVNYGDFKITIYQD